MKSPIPSEPEQDFQLASLVDLLEKQDEGLRTVFVKAINLYATPGAGALNDREKIDQLRQALEQSMTFPKS